MIPTIMKHLKYLFTRPEIITAIVTVLETCILYIPNLLFGKKKKYSNKKGQEYIPGESTPEIPSTQDDTKIKKQKRKSKYPQYIEGTEPIIVEAPRKKITKKAKTK